MPEIIIAQVDATKPLWSPERVRHVLESGSYPDRSGEYRLESGMRIDLNLSQIMYEPEAPNRNKVGVGERGVAPHKSLYKWPVGVYCGHLGIGHVRSRYEVPQIEYQWLTVDRKGRGVLMMPRSAALPHPWELMVTLNHPIISARRETNGMWVQEHYYPDYPQMGGVIDSKGNRIWPPARQVMVRCCGGEGGNCIAGLCPNYQQAKGTVDRSWPRTAIHEMYLAAVKAGMTHPGHKR